jgi:hypothetical protein
MTSCALPGFNSLRNGCRMSWDCKGRYNLKVKLTHSTPSAKRLYPNGGTGYMGQGRTAIVIHGMTNVWKYESTNLVAQRTLVQAPNGQV